MKKTFREKVLFSVTKTAKKHKRLKTPLMCLMTVLLAVYYAGLKIAANGKRYSCVLFVFLFMVVSSSFSTTESLTGQGVAPAQDGAQLTAEKEIDTAEVAVIEADEDVLVAMDDVELLQEEEIDTYTLEEILENNAAYREMMESTATESMQGTQTTEKDFSSYQFDPTDWRLILINKQHSIPEEYEFPLGNITASLQCDERILEDLLDMMQAAKEDGVDLIICSPYRDYNRQTYLFKKKITRYMNAGMSYMDAYKTASVTVTAPNASEHQIGLAIDFYCSSYMKLDEGFENTEAGMWLAAHSCEYGFILRYPKGKEYITGIIYEPWHFRYVGVEAATVITESGITLEEFWEDL